VPTIHPRHRLEMVGTLRFAHPTGLNAFFNGVSGKTAEADAASAAASATH
jgi:hypothetical protein